MSGLKFRFFVLLIVLFAACHEKEVQIVSKKELINILADLHFADGVLDQSPYKKYHQYDTIKFHEYVYEKYGYTKADIDSSIAYYTSKDLELINGIYDKVTERLQHQSAMLADSLKGPDAEEINIWNLKDRWTMPRDGIHEKIEVDIPIHKAGTYTLTADIRIYPDDASVNPRVNLYFFKEDSTNENGKRHYFRSDFLDKNGIFYHVNISEELSDSTFTHIKGQLLAHTNANSVSWKKHAEVKDIKLIYKPPKPAVTDSLKNPEKVVRVEK